MAVEEELAAFLPAFSAFLAHLSVSHFSYAQLATPHPS